MRKISLAKPCMFGNELKYVESAVESTWISSLGEYVTRFETGFASYCGLKYGVATSNGTTALHLALVALGIKEGDEVIVPDMTFAATINAVIYTGATPVIVDVERDGWCMDVEQVQKSITPKTKAIIAVHLYGQPCDMRKLCDLTKKYNLFLIEDCAEAHGAEFEGKKVGSFGDVSCFSFYGNKIITTGEGGMCLTDSKELNVKLRFFRDHGMSSTRRYYHEVVGYNYRLTNLQAAIGVAQMETIESNLLWRNELDRKYRSLLDNQKGIELQKSELLNRKNVTWLFSILVEEDKRDYIMEQLSADDIECRPFFVPLSQMDVYKKYSSGSYPVSNEISKRGINLPTTYDLSDNDIERICELIKKCLV